MAHVWPPRPVNRLPSGTPHCFTSTDGPGAADSSPARDRPGVGVSRNTARAALASERRRRYQRPRKGSIVAAAGGGGWGGGVGQDVRQSTRGGPVAPSG